MTTICPQCGSDRVSERNIGEVVNKNWPPR